jgi:hypothetical protein
MKAWQFLALTALVVTSSASCLYDRPRDSEKHPEPEITLIEAPDTFQNIPVSFPGPDGKLISVPGPCCIFAAAVKFTLADDEEFVRKVIVNFELADSAQGITRHVLPRGDAEVETRPRPPRAVTFDVDIPNEIANKGSVIKYTIVLVTGRGELSRPASKSIRIQ